MIADDSNETDVREEIAVPLLSMLGYEANTKNGILREFSISYPREFLGRKKRGDPPLRGRADYILSVAGAGRWVLEIKAPNQRIDKDAIDQMMSYARHPEVSGSYAAILNGKRLVVMHSSQSSADDPILDLGVESVEQVVGQVRNLLSPAAFMRDCSPPVVDVRESLAEGLRSEADIIGGVIKYAEFVWDSSAELPFEAQSGLNETCRRMCGYRTSVTGGRVWRDDTSRIRAKLDMNVPHDAILEFIREKKIIDAEYVALADTISDDPSHPTCFDVVGEAIISEGDYVFDIIHWNNITAQIKTEMVYRGQAVGYIAENRFFGLFRDAYDSSFPSVPGDLHISMFGTGSFEILLDPR